MNSERLKDFRQAAYELLVRAKDATFELMDERDDHSECVVFSGIFAQSIIQSSQALRLRSVTRL